VRRPGGDDATEEGAASERIAKRFGVSTAWIRRLRQRRRETGSLAALPQNAGRKPALNERQMGQLGRLVGQRPEATLRELKGGWRVSISDGAMLRALLVLGLTLKKSRSARRSRSGRT
jgi:transposase